MPTTPAKSKTARGDKVSPDPVVDLTSHAQRAAPTLPHERDEGVGMTGGVPSKRVRQAHRDVVRGVQDTSRAPEADAAYKKQKDRP